MIDSRPHSMQRPSAKAWRRQRPVPGCPSILRRMLEPANLAAAAVLFWMSGPVAPLIPNLDNTLSELFTIQAGPLPPPVDANDELLRMSWIPVYLLVLTLAFGHWRVIGHFLLRQRTLLLLIGWTFLSTLWSVSPEDTLRRSIALSASTVFGLYLGTRFDVLWVVRLLAMALALEMLASLICGMAFSDIGVASEGEYAGAWRGVYVSKNSLGATMLIACLVYYVLYAVDRSRWHLLGIGIALGLLALSMSRTPVVILLALVPSLSLTRRFSRDPRRFGIVIGLTLCAAGIVALFAGVMLQSVLELLGRDVTLTGRTDIWSLTWDAIQERFWTGYGYGAFWSNPWGPATEIWDALSWRAPSSHSGLLELWLALGLIGVMLFVWLMVQTFLRIIASAPLAKPEQALWVVGYFVIFLVHAITEPSMMEQTSISWVLFVAIACARGSPLGRARRRTPTPFLSPNRLVAARDFRPQGPYIGRSGTR